MISQERMLRVIKSAHISEKATNNSEKNNTLVFKVALNANKVEIAQAVELLFDIKVDSVRTVRTKGKTIRGRHGMSKRSDWKKAYVTLQDGQNLDFLNGAE